MAKAWVSEYQHVGAPIGVSSGIESGVPVLATLVKTQVIDFTAGATQSAAFDDSTRFVRIQVDTTAHFLIGDDPTADANDEPATGLVEYIRGVRAGNKISIIAGA